MHLPRFFGKIKVTLETKLNPAFIKQNKWRILILKVLVFFSYFLGQYIE